LPEKDYYNTPEYSAGFIFLTAYIDFCLAGLSPERELERKREREREKKPFEYKTPGD